MRTCVNLSTAYGKHSTWCRGSVWLLLVHGLRCQTCTIALVHQWLRDDCIALCRWFYCEKDTDKRGGSGGGDGSPTTTIQSDVYACVFFVCFKIHKYTRRHLENPLKNTTRCKQYSCTTWGFSHAMDGRASLFVVFVAFFPSTCFPFEAHRVSHACIWREKTMQMIRCLCMGACCKCITRQTVWHLSSRKCTFSNC